MSRSKQKGTAFEAQVAGYLSRVLGDGRIERRALGGTNDRGDVAGVTIRGKRTVVECKNHREMRLSEWLDEAEAERGNDDAEFAVVVHKRRGCGEASFGGNYATMTLETLAAIIAGARCLLEGGGDGRAQG